MRLGAPFGKLRHVWLLAGMSLFLIPQTALAGDLRLLFTGDILLSRQVRAEMERTGRSPWEGWPPILREADWVVGNLEGAVGDPADCVSSSERSPCFALTDSALAVLHRAGFRALGMANNHSGDLGKAGRRATRQALAREGLGELSFEGSPGFWRLGELTVGVVAFSMVAGPDGQRVEVPSPLLRQKLRLARRLANLVVIYVHWGSELLEWPNTEQRRAADWLVTQGADLIVGHHPHVVQPFEYLQGKPVFYSLGNHVFDQKYPATKEGLIADCRIRSGRLLCATVPTHTPPGSAFPRLVSVARDSEREAATQHQRHSREGGNPGVLPASPPCGSDSQTLASRIPSPTRVTPATPAMDDAASKTCARYLGAGFIVAGYTLRPVPVNLAAKPAARTSDNEHVLEAVKDGKVQWRTQPVRLLALDAGRLTGPDGPELLVTLERHGSPLDHEDSPRPYVYEMTAHGPVARWRGTALAWPLLDTALLPGENSILCALHRGDSYLVPNPQTPRTRVAAYRWNGFGFSGIDDPAIQARCTELFDPPSQPATNP
jgi:hypothetical protein